MESLYFPWWDATTYDPYDVDAENPQLLMVSDATRFFSRWMDGTDQSRKTEPVVDYEVVFLQHSNLKRAATAMTLRTINKMLTASVLPRLHNTFSQASRRCRRNSMKSWDWYRYRKSKEVMCWTRERKTSRIQPAASPRTQCVAALCLLPAAV